MNIRTRVTHTDSGSTKVKATGAGKQRTISYDHERSHDANMGEAAGTLALALGLDWHDGITHEQDGPVHVFTF